MPVPCVRWIAVAVCLAVLPLALSAAVPAAERDALLALYQSTGGAEWSDRSGWLGAPGTECSWTGVTCDGAGGAVVGVILPDNSLHGTLPDLSALTRLETLTLSFNQIAGPIPQTLGAISTLDRLELAGNQFTGMIPASLSNLSALRTLDLSDNLLTGPIPGFVGTLSSLEWLDLHGNQLSGPIPDSYASLSALTWLDLRGNAVGGAIPPWIGELPNLEGLLLAGTGLSGSIPESIGQLTRLSNLVLTANRLSGPIPSSIGELRDLAYLTLDRNQLSGEIPDGLWTLTELRELRLDDNELTGTIPSAAGQLAHVEVMLLGTNHLSGTIPASIGGLDSVVVLGLGSNRLEGAIPPEIGQLSRLEALDLDQNRLRGAIPSTLMDLAALADGGLRIGYNLLEASSPALRAFLDEKSDGAWESTQTIAPANVSIGERTDRSIVVSWTPIEYQLDGGGYEVVATPAGGGAPIVATSASKSHDSVILRGAEPSTSYSIAVRTTTHPHGYQQNFLRSDAAPAVNATTSARQFRPAEVDLVRAPMGLIRAGGETVVQDSFVLANFGDVATTITLGRTETFFTQTPESFTLAPGAAQTVVLAPAPGVAPGSYYGYSAPQGDGVAPGFLVQVILLAVETAQGAALAEAVSGRVDVAGEAGTDSVGTATFRNVGAADVAGVLLSDVDWIRTRPEAIAIPPGEVRSVSFDILRSRRPVDTGAVSGTVRLVYVAGGMGSQSLDATPSNGSGVSSTLVTVVDTARPPVAPGSIPALAAGEIARLIPGIASLESPGSTIVSDVVLTNSFGARPLSDVRIFYRPHGGAARVATLGSLAPSQTVGLSDVVNVYGAPRGVGTLHVRSRDADKLQISASLVQAISTGIGATALPVFRSDRAISGGERLHLVGFPPGSAERSVVYLQETSGGTAEVQIEFLDATGNPVGSRLDRAVGPFEAVELTEAVPPQAATAIVELTPSSSGDLVAWTLVSDLDGSRWPVVDWNRFAAIPSGGAIRIGPVGASDGGENRVRRRPVRRGGSGSGSSISSASSPVRTVVTLFNSAQGPGRAKLTLHESSGVRWEREVTVAARRTITIEDAATFVRGSTLGSMGSLTIAPLEGALHAAARSAGGGGVALPIAAATSGARLGQSMRFAGLHDSTRATVEAGRPGTYRTGFGMTEAAGGSVTVRAEVVLAGRESRVAAQIARDFQLGPNQTLFFGDMLRAIVGELRETRFGDLRDLQLELRVVSGDGAALFFIRSEENASKDAVLRTE